MPGALIGENIRPRPGLRNPGAQWLLIIISRTEGLMCGINRRYMGDYGMTLTTIEFFIE